MTQTLSGAVSTEPAQSASALPRRRTLVWSLLLFVLALLCLMVTSSRVGINPFGSSGINSHFVYQAQSFLEGRLDIPHFAHEDIILVNGKYYIVYPPFPAIVMMPFVAVFGLGFSDIFFVQVCSALNVVLLFWLLEVLRAGGRSRRTFAQNAALAIFFFFGSINFYLSLGGGMWFTAHILATTCTLAFLLLAFKRRFVWSALCLGCAFLTRAPAVAGLPVLLYLLLEEQTPLATWKAWREWLRQLPWRKLALALVPLLAALLVFLARNALAFGSPWETGYTLLIRQFYPEVQYGVLGPHYIWSDVVANFLNFPTFSFRDAFDISPGVDFLDGGIGLSVFATTPIFLFLFFARNRQPSGLRKVLWLVVGLVVAATLLYHAAGWFQFGSRYLFEAYSYAFLLLALSEIEFTWRFYLLGLVGIVVNLLGAVEYWTTLAPALGQAEGLLRLVRRL
jgi:hypothetical protein